MFVCSTVLIQECKYCGFYFLFKYLRKVVYRKKKKHVFFFNKGPKINKKSGRNDSEISKVYLTYVNIT